MMSKKAWSPGRIIRSVKLCGWGEQRDLVRALDLARVEHHLLAVADLEAQALQLEQERRLDQVDAEWHPGDALRDEDRLDLRRRALEQLGLRRHRPAQADHARQAVRRLEPRRVQAVVLGRRAEVPHVGVAGAGEKRPARELVA